MSTWRGDDTGSGWMAGDGASENSFGPRSRRALALGATLLLVASYLRVLYYVTDVAGGSDRLILFVALSLVAATVLARFLPAVGAFVLALALFGVGLWGYIQAVPNGELLLRSLGAVGSDVLALLTGLSILQIMEAGTWAVGFAPAPTFLVWYLALRRRYVAAGVVGGATTGFFVLTGDAHVAAVLAGAVGVAGVVGFGELERDGGGVRQAETLVLVLAAMVVLAPFVSIVPGGASQPLIASGSGAGGPTTIEAGLLSAGDQVNIQGSISLSPKVRFTVESNTGDYWQVASYDRYTGGGWVRTGSTEPYSGSLSGPPGNATTVEQTYTMKTAIGVMPAAWKPVRVSGTPAKNARVTALSGFQPDGELANGTTYSVESQRPAATPAELRSAGVAYPNDVVDTYTQLPESTPARVERRTDRVTANAGNPYDKARTIERWLENTKGYSLNVSRPNGNIADSFLFEMNEGYCTYFATTMVTMLRTQGVPARFVTGYTDGQRVAQDEWVVRGYDSHAWVEVYFPDTGWVRFDPTPAAPREAVEQSNLDNARAGNETGIDANGSLGGEWTPTPTPTPIGGTPTPNGSVPVSAGTPPGLDDQLRRAANGGNPGATNASVASSTVSGAGGGGADGGSGGVRLPSPTPRQWAFVLVVLVGLFAAARRSGLLGRVYGELWVRIQPDGSPTEAAERAFSRLEYLLAREYRPRRPGETPKEYLTVLRADDRAVRVGEVYERAHYAGSVSEADADEAVALVDQLVAERTPILGRFRGSRRGRGPDSI